MKYAMAFGLAAMLAVVGCDNKAAPSKAVDKGGDKKGDGHDGHAHGKGPHGGIIFDLGKFHGEFTVDHAKKECVVYVLGMDEKTAAPVAAKDMQVTTKETKSKDGKAVPAMTIKLTAKDEKDGKASVFAGTDAGLATEAEHEGSVTGVIDGKPAKGEFKE